MMNAVRISSIVGAVASAEVAISDSSSITSKTTSMPTASTTMASTTITTPTSKACAKVNEAFNKWWPLSNKSQLYDKYAKIQECKVDADCVDGNGTSIGKCRIDSHGNHCTKGFLHHFFTGMTEYTEMANMFVPTCLKACGGMCKSSSSQNSTDGVQESAQTTTPTPTMRLIDEAIKKVKEFQTQAGDLEKYFSTGNMIDSITKKTDLWNTDNQMCQKLNEEKCNLNCKWSKSKCFVKLLSDFSGEALMHLNKAETLLEKLKDNGNSNGIIHV